MMIGTVFFLAIAAPILAAVYPTTTSNYRETTYQPRTRNYNPSQAPGNNNPSQAPGNYNPSQAPGNYNPSQAPGNYNPSQAPGNYNPSQAPGNYNPSQAPSNYNPSGNPQNYNPTKQVSGYGSQPSSSFFNTPKFYVHETRNIRREISDASAEISSALRTDQIYQDNLEVIAQKINQSSNFRRKFEDYLYRRLIDIIAVQGQKIADYRSQVDSLSDLNDDVRDLINNINSLARDLGNIRNRQANIRATLGQVGDTDGSETLSLVTVEDQIDGNDEILEIIRKTDQPIRARYDANLRNLDLAVQTINDETVKEFIIVLTARNSSVYVPFRIPFNRQPQVAYGIIGLEIDDINNDRYGSQQQNNNYGSQQQNNNYGSQQQDNNYGSQQQNNSYGSQQQTNNYDSQQQTNNYGSQQQTNNYGSQQQRIFPRVVARADTKGLTVTLIDNSLGYRTERVRVRVIAAYVNNGNILPVNVNNGNILPVNQGSTY